MHDPVVFFNQRGIEPVLLRNDPHEIGELRMLVKILTRHGAIRRRGDGAAALARTIPKHALRASVGAGNRASRTHGFVVQRSG
jgi:hypothetical protein